MWSAGEIKVFSRGHIPAYELMNVKTGVYHAGVDDYEKERIHVDWRKGTVK